MSSLSSLVNSETVTLYGEDIHPQPYNMPTIASWQRLWAFWDLVTLRMIPREMLHHKPIDLRHKCLFYIGHIPTFLDMLVVKEVHGEGLKDRDEDGNVRGYTDKWFVSIFERGIDPHVDDPDHCHVGLSLFFLSRRFVADPSRPVVQSHSEVPTKDEDWPSLEAIISYRDRIRARLMRIYEEIESGKKRLTKRLVRVMQMAYEHEGWHIEVGLLFI
jgi:hypothetical protein